MPLHTEVSFQVGTYTDSTKANVNQRMMLDVSAMNDLTVEASGTIHLAASAIAQELSLQSVTMGKLLVVKSDYPVTVLINDDEATPLTLTPRTNSHTGLKTPGFLAMLVDDIESIFLTNPAASEIWVDFSVVGTTDTPPPPPSA